MNQQGDLTAIAHTWHVFHITYIIMLTMPPYFIPDAGCLSLRTNIHNGHQVNKVGHFTCCL